MTNEEPTRSRTRASDPSTSHEAADRVARSNYEENCYNFLRRNWPRWYSSFEVADYTGIHLSAVTPRWIVLELDKHLVERSKAVRLNSIGVPRNVTVWRAINPNATWFYNKLPREASA
jgi:hypothetical protein